MKLFFKKWLEAKKYSADQKKRLRKAGKPSFPKSTGSGRSIYGGSM
jgi:hypothetical protein